jgi:hypothetical protein
LTGAAKGIERNAWRRAIGAFSNKAASGMKKCEYCGQEDDDEAARCRGCGTEFARGQAPGDDAQKGPGATERLENIATLDNEVQAGLLEAVLSDRNIPHLMQSYHDSAYDGIFQVQKGWGAVLAPPGFKAEILAVLEDVKRQSL